MSKHDPSKVPLYRSLFGCFCDDMVYEILTKL